MLRLFTKKVASSPSVAIGVSLALQAGIRAAEKQYSLRKEKENTSDKQQPATQSMKPGNR